eukprot:TRINITY_DN1135_c0_g1_i1.p1 TRINITY_DN1135_c0_g1~~TRINITY_DN1135_c0_g1_i1.p1  ORF type:complete len:162 (+),score=19.10 TRINITY_DN1135_c0_g1_i1:69-488(+)
MAYAAHGELHPPRNVRRCLYFPPSSPELQELPRLMTIFNDAQSLLENPRVRAEVNSTATIAYCAYRDVLVASANRIVIDLAGRIYNELQWVRNRLRQQYHGATVRELVVLYCLRSAPQFRHLVVDMTSPDAAPAGYDRF